MNQSPFRFLLALVALAVVASSVPLFAQDYPLPRSVDEDMAYYGDLKTFQYDSPIASHVGRLVDSGNADQTQCGLKTIRSTKFRFAANSRKNGAPARVYAIAGDILTGWTLDSDLPLNIDSVPASATVVAKHVGATAPCNRSVVEKAQDSFQTFTYLYKFLGDINRGLLLDFDFDDRGYVYQAFSEGGWQAYEDKAAGGKMSLVTDQDPADLASPAVIFSLESGGKYYVAVQDSPGSAKFLAWYDVTTPSAPKRLSDKSIVVDEWAKDYENKKIAIVDKTGVLRIYSWDNFATGGGAQASYSPSAGYSFNGIAFDDRGRLWATEGSGSPSASVLTQIKPTGATTWEKNVYSVYPTAVNATHVAAWGGYVAVQGRTGGGYDLMLFKLAGDVPEFVDTNNYFQKYYHTAPAGYALPGRDARKQEDVGLVKAGTKILLFYQTYGMGDVYQLGAAGPSINVTMEGAPYGTSNSNSQQASDGPYPGDPLVFKATTASGSYSLDWNFGNSDSSDNTGSNSTGSNITHQFSGLNTLSKVTSKKTVTATVSSDSSISDTYSVQLVEPTARIAVKSTSLPVTAGGFEVVAGDKFVDASDGSVQSHYSVWTISGSPANAKPNDEIGVGAVGNRTVTLETRYGKYNSSTFAQADAPFVKTVGSYSYKVLPFLATLKPLVKSGTDVIFDATAAFTGDTSILSAAQWTVEWTLLGPAGGTDASQSNTIALSTNVPDFTVPQADVKDGSTIRLRISVASGAPVGYTEYLVEKTLTLPDPKITKTGCTNVGMPCTLTVSSIGGKSMSTWTLAWDIKRSSGSTVKSGSSTSVSFTPSASDTYTATLVATEAAVLSKTVTLDFFIDTSSCPNVVSDANLIISYTGATSGCTKSNGVPCQKGENIAFKAGSFGYSFQACDTYKWDFGDGGSATTKDSSHNYSGSKTSYPVKLTVTNDNGSASTTVTVPFTAGGGEVCTSPSSIAISWSGSKGCSPSKACEVGESVKFTAKRGSSSLLSCDGASWSFGDGKTSTLTSPSKSYGSTGTFTVGVTISNTAGSASASKSMTVVPSTGGGGGCSVAPTQAQILFSYTGAVSGCTKSNGIACLPGEDVQFEAKSFGYDYDSCSHNFSWDFGDGDSSTDRDPSHAFNGASSLVQVSMTVSNSQGSATVAQSVAIQGGVPVKPTPVLTFESFPATATVGSPVTFKVNSNIPATEWIWTFSDGSPNDVSQFATVGTSSTIQHTFTRTSASGFTVKVTAKNAEETLPGVTGSVQNKVKVEQSTEIRFLIPVASHVAGQGNSSWRTDVQIYNPDPSVGPSKPLPLKFQYNGKTYPTDGSWMGLTKSTTIMEDFLYKLIGDDCKNPATGDIVCAGPVIVITNAPLAPQIWTRTYNQTDAGTYGQLIPAVRLDGVAASAVAAPVHYHMAGLRADERFRTNIGFVNPNMAAIVASVRIFSETGGLLAEFTKALNPFTFTQQTIDPATFATPLPLGARFSIEVQTPGGEWLIAYASLIDSKTGDPVYFNAMKANDLQSADFKTMIVPGISHTGQWRSDATVFNPNESWMVLRVEYFDMAGAPVGTAAEGIVLGPNQFIHWDDVLKQGVLGTIPDGAGSFRITVLSENAMGPMATARTYFDDSANGTYGQGIGGFAAARPNVKPGKVAIVPGVRDDENYYTNMGLMNLSATAVNVKVTVLDPETGAAGKIQNYSVAPNQMIIGRFFLNNEQTLKNATLKVEADGNVWAFVSVIDNKGGAGTHDPEYIPAVMLP